MQLQCRALGAGAPRGVPPRAALSCRVPQSAAVAFNSSMRGRVSRVAGGGQRPRPCARRRVSALSLPHQPYPWHERDYYRASLQLVQGNLSGVSQGYLLLMREGQSGVIEDAGRGLVLAVGGDTLAGIAMLMQGREGERPLSLELLWRILERGQEISKRDWRVLRVAIVELRGSTYIGRLFFGDAEGGQVAWDVDCRPSDACWLSLKSKCPIFIRRGVWEDNATSLSEMAAEAPQQGDYGDARSAALRRTREDLRQSMLGALGVSSEEDGSPMRLMTTPRPADPELLKRLKMELRVALKEEDYTEAARIRDHPLMQLHLEGMAALARGDTERARTLEQQLFAAVSAYENAGGAAGSGEE